MRKIISVLFCLLLFVSVDILQAQQSTTLIVRARAKGAKFIGSSMGGAMVVVREKETGKILASGLTEGGTGDTDLLMKKPHSMGMKLSTDGTAKFETTLQLKEPVLAEVEVKGPMAQQQSSVISSTEIWLIPGKNINGDGLIIQVPGFVVDILGPHAHKFVQMKGASTSVPIRASVVMMCGCPTSEGGLWDSSQYEIKALIQKNGETVDTVPLKYTGEMSTYQGMFKPASPGAYEIMVYAYDPNNGNTGLDKTTVVVTD